MQELHHDYLPPKLFLPFDSLPKSGTYTTRYFGNYEKDLLKIEIFLFQIDQQCELLYYKKHLQLSLEQRCHFFGNVQFFQDEDLPTSR